MSEDEKLKSSKKIKWGKTLFFVIAFGLFIRCFFIESYSVLSKEMDNSILKGEFLFVDKAAYGVRLPITILSIPFVPDSISLFGGFRTYSQFCQFPYIRFNTKPVKRNDVIVFNNPLDTINIPIDKKRATISRCIALPGDTFETIGYDYYINGKKIAQSSKLKLPYKCHNKFSKKVLDEYAPSLNINIQILHSSSDSIDNHCYFLLSRYEYYQLKDIMPEYIKFELLHELPEYFPQNKYKNREALDYKIIIPENSYWVLSDNPYESVDSRYIGFIPHTHIIGKAKSIWFSKNQEENIPWYNLSKTVRWTRILSTIN